MKPQTLLITILLITTLFLILNINKPRTLACTSEAKLCPDEITVVSRNHSLNCEFNPCPAQEKNFCPPESRNVDLCIEIYQPVCGWPDPDKVRCVKYPCATTYSNNCFACMDKNVLYYTEGKCPK